MFHFEVADAVAVGIVVEQTVEAYALDAGYVGAEGGVGLETSACAYTYEGELTECGVVLAGLEIDVGKSIELVDNDINVVTAYTCGEDGDAFAVVCACNGVELAGTDFVFATFEVGRYGIDAPWVAYENDLVCKMFWLQMEVEG